MKVRIKFSKIGPVKFIGHLDTMRYFQKAIRRAALPVAYSAGYSPHMIMSFAAPLGVGTESLGEYFDLELAKDMETEEITRALEEQMAEGFHVLKTTRIADGKAGKAMSIAAAADYYVFYRSGKAPLPQWQEKLAEFAAQKEIRITKETKNGSRELDIRPWIYEMEKREEGVFLRLASASANYTRPDTVMDAFSRWLGREPLPFACQIRKLELYANTGSQDRPVWTSLGDLKG